MKTRSKNNSNGSPEKGKPRFSTGEYKAYSDPADTNPQTAFANVTDDLTSRITELNKQLQLLIIQSKIYDKKK